MWLSKVSIHVCPSAATWRRSPTPTAPVPPRLVVDQDVPAGVLDHLGLDDACTGSVEPPGGNGTMILRAPLGQSAAPWARGEGGAPECGYGSASQQRTAFEASSLNPPCGKRLVVSDFRLAPEACFYFSIFDVREGAMLCRNCGVTDPWERRRRLDFFAKRVGIGYLPAMSLTKVNRRVGDRSLGWKSMPSDFPTPSSSSGGPRPTFGADPNTQVSLVDAAMPGMLPVINERCVEQAIRTGSASMPRSTCARSSTGRTISTRTCPQGYQISQYKDPIVGEGAVEIDLPTARPAPSASNGCTSSRTPARACTTSIPARPMST